MIPTVPSNPSVALSERDRAFIQSRRAEALKRRRRQTMMVVCAFGFYLFAISILGGDL